MERGSDGSEIAYVTGQTCSTNLTSARAYGGNCDAYVTALKADGSAPLYTTYIGGENADSGKAIAVRNGIVTVAGTTNSTHFPVQGLSGKFAISGHVRRRRQGRLRHPVGCFWPAPLLHLPWRQPD